MVPYRPADPRAVMIRGQEILQQLSESDYRRDMEEPRGRAASPGRPISPSRRSPAERDALREKLKVRAALAALAALPGG